MQPKKVTTPKSKTPMATKLKQVTQAMTPKAKLETLTHSPSTPSMLKTSSSKYLSTPKKPDQQLIKAHPASEPNAKKKAMVNKSLVVSPSNAAIKYGISHTKTPSKDQKIFSPQIVKRKPVTERPAIPKLVNSTAIDFDLNTTSVSNLSGVKTSLNASLNVSCNFSINSATNSRVAPRIGIRPQTCVMKNQPQSQFFKSNSNKSLSIEKRPVSSTAQKNIKQSALSNLSFDLQKTQNIANELMKAAPAIEFPYRWLFFGPQITYEKVIRHLIMVYKGLYYVVNSLKEPSAGFIEAKRVALPPRVPDKKKTLILDLDETLIHSCRAYEQPDAVLEVKGSRDQTSKISIKIRPHIEEFFKKVSPYYEIVVFTAASRVYARAVVDYLDHDHRYISHLFTREDCMETQSGFHIKDLRIFKERDLSELVIVDNLIHSFGFQIDNGIPIIEYHGDRNDQELLHLADYLLKAKDAKDIRQFNREQLLLHKMLQHDFDSIQKDIFNAFHRSNLNKTLAELYVAS